MDQEESVINYIVQNLSRQRDDARRVLDGSYQFFQQYQDKYPILSWWADLLGWDHTKLFLLKYAEQFYSSLSVRHFSTGKLCLSTVLAKKKMS